MPQIDQLSEIFASQLFWLLLVFGTLYFGIGRGMVPKIQGVVEKRDSKIAEDLAAAQRAREDAETVEEEYRQQIETSRAESMKVAQAAKQKAALQSEKQLRKIEDQVAAKIAEAEARIRDSVDKARKELEPVAVEAAAELVAKLTGTPADPAQAKAAVKAALHG